MKTGERSRNNAPQVEKPVEENRDRDNLVAVLGTAFAAPARAEPSESANCVAQFVSDVNESGLLTIGELQGHKPFGQAHVFQPFGSILKIQATADHSACPFTFEP